MSNFGLKCFVGSFIFSLAAVFAVVWGHENFAAEENLPPLTLAENEVHNIELFAATEENDPLYEKFVELQKVDAAPQEDDDSTESAGDGNTETVVANGSAEILYFPEDITEDETAIYSSQATLDEVQDEESIGTSKNGLVDDSENQNSKNDVKENADEELKIVDASLAPEFVIPLVHNYKGGSATAQVSHETESNQIALASQDVALDNLGIEGANNDRGNEGSEGLTDKLAQATNEYDNPWEVAEVANPNITKNSMQPTAKTEDELPVNENHVPYKMQKNILIPIPEELNNKDLTPQFSSSAENRKLEDELRRKHGLPTIEEQKEIEKAMSNAANEEKAQAGAQSGNVKNGKSANQKELVDIDDDLDDEEDEELEDESATLTDSIAAWFKNSRKKSAEKNNKSTTVKRNVIINKTKVSPATDPQANKESSIFQKLLGLRTDKESDILPTELKLSFQPDRAEISGQTLEWLRAFSDNVVNNEDVIIEIRIDRSAPYELQQKRLKLLYRILANNGVEYNKVNIIFTDREPNSFIIRNVRLATEEEKKIEAAKLGDNPW